ncbi:SGNH/GDSL hydrolase family protein [Phnomibacter ginsenosidimutans]|uniref:G-D-S-L family lipolytic protein n=1 Tax=Phnomibacter ginsenosidimutans TaxID=2676868 RepID=A0A6I6G2B4_9BACT|nr:SGNH/GDSL hydrolase family protein [Phnomibacter ginsenosidimutans]QGW26726.1 G-D-S-L family lipolytic protein [Phnomibacter ginsenosidimutans]
MKRIVALFALLAMMISWLPVQKKKVVFFGDSITQMGVNNGGYIWRMQQMLEQKKLSSQYELIGAGIGGNKVYDLYLRMESDVLDKNPDIVFIYIGVNDIWHKATSQTGTDFDKFGKFYTAIINKLKAKNIEVILVTPAGIGELKGNANPQDADLNKYSDAIRQLANTHQLKLVDLRAFWQSYNEANNPNNQEKGQLSYDRVHLNDTGNQLVAEAMLKALGL